MTFGKVYIGTAGFSYRDWLGNFYPQFCPQADFLRCYAMTFSTVELDSTFYRIPTRQILDKWAQTTPPGFRFAAKFPRTVTHDGDLRTRLEEAGKFLSVMETLGEKLGPLLLQFPASFRANRKADLQEMLAVVPKSVKLAVEFRDRGWFTEETAALLRERGVGLCLTEYPGVPRLVTRTAGFVYFRFVGDRDEITDDFSHVRLGRSEELAYWADLAERFAGENADVYAYFNNHFSGHAPSTALQFRERLR
ncbi:MAG: DUF72 domain-containing protein [Candidatus Zixiibacteriota bacterium]